jgi:hypothetical protein
MSEVSGAFLTPLENPRERFIRTPGRTHNRIRLNPFLEWPEIVGCPSGVLCPLVELTLEACELPHFGNEMKVNGKTTWFGEGYVLRHMLIPRRVLEAQASLDRRNARKGVGRQSSDSA